MEGNLRSSMSSGCPRDFAAVLKPDTSSFAAHNCNKDQEDYTAWTDEKHNSYLSQLEGSFVKQMHQSKGLLAQSSKQNQTNMNMYQKRSADCHNSTEQITVLRNGYWRKKNYGSGYPVPHTSADSEMFLRRPWIHHLKHLGMDCPPPSLNMEESLMHFGIEKQGKRIMSHGLAAGSQQFSSFNPSYRDFSDLTTEGTDQNFLDEDDESKKSESQAKRLKRASVESSSQDQIVPSKNDPTTDDSAIHNSTLQKN